LTEKENTAYSRATKKDKPHDVSNAILLEMNKSFLKNGMNKRAGT